MTAFIIPHNAKDLHIISKVELEKMKGINIVNKSQRTQCTLILETLLVSRGLTVCQELD